MKAMKALIFNNHVIDIQEHEFEVYKDMYWVDCDDTVKYGFSYINDTFINTSIQSKTEIDLQKIAQAKAYLSQTDYKVLPDYDGDITGVLEARADARALIRSLQGE